NFAGATTLVGYLVLFVALAVFFVFIHLVMGRFIRPVRPDPDKLTIYECGEPTIGSSWIQFDLRFYVVALLFVIFDVEVAFFFPWAVVFGQANTVASATVDSPSLEQAINWGRQSSMWPMTFGLACCAIAMMATGASRFDMDRFGAGASPATPRQAHLMIVASTVNYKMASRVRRLYNQMPDPKFVIAMGACTCGGGPYYKYGYNVVKGVDLVVPVDVYVPGCPPRPEALLEGLMRIQDKVRGMKDL